jgi:acyl-CoA synthetase (NDP forming)/GNAT superfamily N-acetyltransferase
VLLRDGSTLRLQAPTAADFEDLRSFYDGLSDESRYLRFHGHARAELVARAEVEASGVDRQALIARYGGRVVAAASFEGLREPRVAEVAFAVADDLQRRGIAMRMLEQLAAIAADRGIRRFEAEVMAANPMMLNVFGHAGFAVRHWSSSGDVTVSLDITPTDALLGRIDQRDHFAAIASLRPIMAPSSVAVMAGAVTAGNVGARVLANLAQGGFQGAVAVVARVGDELAPPAIASVRSLSELAAAPELVIIAADGEEQLEFAAQAAASGARALLVMPAGPAAGDAGPAREQRLLEIVRGAGLRLVGPNSLGVINTAPETRLNATFTGAGVRAGALAICSQTGAPGLGLIGQAHARELGISMLASLGSHADVSTNDLLECWEEDERTSAVALYLETFTSPEHFIRIAQRVSRNKPILAVKARRRSQPPRRDAQSQTAAALRGEAVVDALLRQAGVLRFGGAEELFDAAEFFVRQPLPRGRRIGIVTNAIGVTTLAADACAARRLEIPSVGGARNPLLLGVNAGPEEYATSVRALLRAHRIDAVMAFYVDLYDRAEAVFEAVCAACADHPKPVVASVVRSDGRLPARGDAGVPNFLYPESCAAVLASAAERREWLSRPLGERPRNRDLDTAAAQELIGAFLAREPNGGWLELARAQALLTTHGIPVAVSRHCELPGAAVSTAAQIDGPVALIADGAEIAGTSALDGVLFGLTGESAVTDGWYELEARVRAAGRPWTGAVVRPLPAAGADVLVGAVADPELGLVLAVGLGGPQAGLPETTTFRLSPATDAEADELIDGCQSVVDELAGYRGGAALDRTALRELILRFALLLGTLPEIVEADLNPVRCTITGCIVLDLRLRVAQRRAPQRVKTW